MPSVLTGANLANKDLIYLGVSGDGDSASIGFGQFAHAIRRAVNMVYIVENNGVYGLTKGQFSATADRGSKSKRGVVQRRSASIMAWPCSSVRPSSRASATGAARPLLKAVAQGAAFIDCIALRRSSKPRLAQPALTMREHNEAVNRLDVTSPGATRSVEQARRSVRVQQLTLILSLHKIASSAQHRAQAGLPPGPPGPRPDVTVGAVRRPQRRRPDDAVGTVDTPLNQLGEANWCRARRRWRLNAALR